MAEPSSPTPPPSDSDEEEEEEGIPPHALAKMLDEIARREAGKE